MSIKFKNMKTRKQRFKYFWENYFWILNLANHGGKSFTEIFPVDDIPEEYYVDFEEGFELNHFDNSEDYMD